MNYIWISIILISIIFGVINGNSELMVEILLDTPKSTLEMLINIGGLIIFYNGLFKMAIDSGVINKFSKYFIKIIHLIFPEIPKDHIVNEYICCNIIANMLGLGVASTPIALKVLKELSVLSNNKLSKSMSTFTVLNISSFCILPLSIIGIREVYKADINLELIPLLIIITFLNTVICIFISKIIMRVNNEK